MEYSRFTKLNLELIKNLPSDMQSELIHLEDVIPDDIMATIYFHDSVYKKERHDFLNHRPDLLQEMYQLRHQKRKACENDDFINVETDLNIQFIKKYPQFKQLIECIEYWDESLKVIKTVHIDQYLAEN
ncbi:hypothetical protein SAMN05216439_0208 [Methanobrevibacter gottschalkii]|uniref:Uncharacterized protein n=1 Tax=Methanobrevibacter gottschalkii TaxID=190974 RepID=A0A1H7NGS5_9EURY|nr:hypothetical protein [Methanobrevibacter gottschalkii]SEL22730.1 hypothetical protein SAMN05216439_0208 [Methanobrevibacter gottschalkii]